MLKPISSQENILKFKSTHGDYYNYDKVIYLNSRTKVEIICPIHGSFFQLPNAHIKGNGCNICSKVRGDNKKLEDGRINFLNNIKDIKNLDFSKIYYKGMNNTIEIICPIHGSKFVTPSNFLKSKKCPECSIKLGHDKNIISEQEFIKRSNEIHNNKYQYKNYSNSIKKETEIICPIHGSFFQLPYSHLRGHGCFSCGITLTKAIEELKLFFISLGFKENEDFYINDRTLIKPKELDIYFPKLKIAIEYNGIYWHNSLKKSPSYHLNKTKDCELLGIHLIHICEGDWLLKKEIILSRLKSILGKNKVLYAKSGIIKEISPAIAKKFYEDNHLQGGVYYNKNIGLEIDGLLVSLMSFKDIGEKIELVRFSNLKNFNIVGSASRLLKHFNKTNNKPIISYADRTWSASFSNLYISLGFKQVKISQPNYYWTNGIIKLNKKSCQKKLLIKKNPNFNLSMTESYMMNELGFFKIFNCGTITYLFSNAFLIASKGVI